ncbi:Gfo/Idh/MocA family protein [Eleftheria terrae]|uniref:Gfo/Idh/MocA family protein n=1 Tax=Eleftheria terrae TaxID=1597781 RepID=UPI00263B3E46|nr:Gfo/Idh/MocA family oxidoreductase [Eleftheria terrae]WKB51980.1 Gfo/Idh/MocA family oxidoreductase [Eleftheria terrae]
MTRAAHRSLRWGVLGAGRIAEGALIPALHSLGSPVVAVGCRDATRGAAYAQRNGIATALGYEALLAREDIDAVYIALHNSAHLPWTLAALRAGKHVLCEKPLALSAAEVRDMQAAQAAAGRQVMEAFMYRFHPQVSRAAEIVRSGELGELRLLRGAFGFDLSGLPQDSRWDPALGGGALYDVGCYPLNLMRLLSGHEPELVSADADFSASGVDQLAHVQLRLGSAIGHLDCGFALPLLDHHFELFGSRGHLRLPQPFIAKNVAAELQVSLQGVERIERFEPVDHYALMVAHFERAALGEEALRWGLDDALAQAQALDAILQRIRPA